jgi:hypothetical protein
MKGFWYGAKLIREEGYNVGDVIIVSRNDSDKETNYLLLLEKHRGS